MVNRRKDGSTYDVSVGVQPVLDDHGEPINFVVVYHDISAWKEVDRLKSQFVSDVSHELRTPLTNIRLYLDLVAQTETDQRARRYLGTLLRESERLGSLIEDLLSLSRLEARAVRMNRAPVDINRLLARLIEDRQRLAARRGLDLRVACEVKLPPAKGDARFLSQVFTNLVTNAMNYTPEGGRISVRTQLREMMGEPWITVEVEDTGLGIPPDEQPRIFERFYRGSASRPSGAEGTGLGLSICKEIIEQHGGSIHVTSSGVPGEGSCFTVRLPVAR
jgi:two-component system phosphate regulon sensor histidine kinase PhoR